jgi:hypothetical protein
VEGLPGSLSEAECSSALREIPAVISVSFVRELEPGLESSPQAAADAENANVNHMHDGVPVPENGKQANRMRGHDELASRTAVVEVATAAAVQPLVSHLEMIKVGGCELRARLLLEPAEADVAVQALIDAHEKQLCNAHEEKNCTAEAAGMSAASATPSGGQVNGNQKSNAEDSVVTPSASVVATGVLRLVKALRSEEVESQREAIMHDVRCVAARYGDVVGVDFAELKSAATGSNPEHVTGDAKVDAPMEGQSAVRRESDAAEYRDIVVKYTNCQGADRAALALQGRMFAERPLVAVVDSC